MPRTSPQRAGSRGGTAALVLAAAGLAACAAETAPESAPEPVAAAAQAVDAVPVWTVTQQAMANARHLATATRVPGGAVLIAGGHQIGAVDTGDVYFETAELFDPKKELFAPIAATMSAKRVRHSAVLLGGLVLVVGGNGGPVATADLFDTSSGAWTATPPLAHPRSSAAALVLQNGRALVVGGDPDSATAELFVPGVQTWQETGPMLQPRRLHTATLLADGRVLVTGGQDPADPSKATPSAEIYAPAADAWKAVAPMGTPRLGHTATLLPNGRVLVAGGSTFESIQALGELASAEVYDPASDAWTPVGAMARAHAFHTATPLKNGAVLVAGGVDETSSILRDTELFDPDLLVWVPVGLMTHGRFQHVAVGLADASVLVAGGEHQSSAEIYRSAGVGQACVVGRQCDSGFCVDGVCCDSACEGACLTCALPGAEGVCLPAAPGTDPHQDCGQGGPCDDVCGEAGQCVDRVGELCVAPECTPDRAGAVVPAACQVSGGDCPRVVVPCAPYRCGEAGAPPVAACLTRCESIDDCAPGLACDPEGRCRPRPDVAAADPDACAAAAPGGAPVRAAAGWLAALALAVHALRRRRRPR